MSKDAKELYKTIFKVNHAWGSWTCFYYKKENIFITNYHVVEWYRKLAVENNEKDSYLAEVIMVNPTVDIAFLKCDEDFSKLPNIELSDVEELNIWEKINVAWYPFWMPFTVTEWTISAPKQLMNDNYYIQTDAAVNPWNSWWPMLDNNNKLIAITVSKFVNADNMWFWIPVSQLKKILLKIDEIDRNSFSVECNSCETFIKNEVEYCPSCWSKINEKAFKEMILTDLAIFCEEAIKDMWIDPVIARTWLETWIFHKWSSEIRLFIYSSNYLFCTSPINTLPKDNLAPLLEYLLDDKIKPYNFWLKDNKIFISYRVHISDIFSSQKDRIKKELTEIAFKADKLDDYLHEKFNCWFTEYSKK